MLLGIYGHSRSGKTELVERLTRTLSKKHKVAVIKHISESGFTIDTPGKDTHRHAKAGAELVVASSGDETAYILKRASQLDEMVKWMENYKPDIILVEGFRSEPIPKVSVGEVKEEKNTVAKYRRKEDFNKVLAYVNETIRIEKILEKLPGLDCKRCGYLCRDLAALVAKKKKTLKDCKELPAQDLSVKVNDMEIPMGKFAKKIISQTMVGLISSLKGTENAETIEVKIKRGSK